MANPTRALGATDFTSETTLRLNFGDGEVARVLFWTMASRTYMPTDGTDNAVVDVASLTADESHALAEELPGVLMRALFAAAALLPKKTLALLYGRV